MEGSIKDSESGDDERQRRQLPLRQHQAVPRRGRALTDVRVRDRGRSGEVRFRRERKVLG